MDPPSPRNEAQSRRLGSQPALRAAFATLLSAPLLLWAAWPRAVTETEPPVFELQNESFSNLEWSIAQFRLQFSQQYGRLLVAIEKARPSGSGADAADKNAELAAILENILTEAQTAMPISTMEEYLRRFRRVTGMTNEPPQRVPTGPIGARAGAVAGGPAGRDLAQ